MSNAHEAGLAAEVRRRLGPVPEQGDLPFVSIVVVSRDGAERLRRLLAGLRDRTDYPGFELILVDNASSDGSLELMRTAQAPFPISIVVNPHNESFSTACNQGAQLASGELLLFLNDDTEPFERGWLHELVACALRTGAAAVGSTLIGPAQDGASGRYEVEQRGHRVGEAPGSDHLVPLYRDSGEDPLGGWLGDDAEVAGVAAACLLVRRDEFDRVGGFTPGYWYGGEDSDLSLKLRAGGGGVFCSGRSLIVHLPHSTLNTIKPDTRGAWTRGNRRVLMERWGVRLRREHELDRVRGGGGMWAEAGSGPSPWGATPAEVEALGFCLQSQGPDPAPDLDALAEALRDRGRRAGVLRSAELGSLAAFDYDVAVRFGGPWRDLPDPFRLNLRWLPAAAPAPGDAERSRYDLVLTGGADGPREDPGRLAGRLIATADDLARERGYRGRVVPDGPRAASLPYR